MLPQVLRVACGEQKSTAEQALHSIGGLYEVERKAKDMSDESLAITPRNGYAHRGEVA
jgi:hypothetical protein